ncbi:MULTISPECIES: ABC transporter ATP-binding protein [Methylobacterium]|uniref:ABC transporter related n=3 Tax=Methylobacterium TaxID=407 RepID=A0A0C6FB59_9HYPH|nr:MULTISPECIES: ABC transporter ATP-binding protein [Methylobacterium]BAQ49986.1 ABC transporter related [Methylobacterium aquaticum]SEP51158.1 NitT/TauT family transport system ATP-binding protein [Methylobacterium sp. ap11]
MAAQPNLRGANVPFVPPAPAAPLLRIAQVEKVYGGRQGPVRAVASASLEIGRGEFVSLLGPSGCGKSTLLMMIAGLETPTSGTIELDGSRVVRPRRDIGIIFQDATLLPWKSTLENVLFPIRILKLPLAPYRERARELLAMVGLGGFENHKPSQLSGGMRQRVAICRALIHDPAILLMDEPFSALDAITRDQMNEALSEIMDKTAKTVIFVTHSIREAAFLSDRVVVMGGRPSHVVLDERMPFGRPRRLAIEENPEFGRVVRHLRLTIEQAHGTAPTGRSAGGE